jgi:hypothetical protein
MDGSIAAFDGRSDEIRLRLNGFVWTASLEAVAD